jgi:hypothetical protein
LGPKIIRLISKESLMPMRHVMKRCWV